MKGKVIGTELEDGSYRAKIDVFDGMRRCSWFYLYTKELQLGDAVDITVNTDPK